MNHKNRCLDLTRICARHGTPIRIAISVDRDKYLKHHSGYGGVSWIYCKNNRDIDQAGKIPSDTHGVEAVLTRAEAVRRFHLMGSRIGDLAIPGDRDTVFGDLDAESEPLASGYRAHGSLHEIDVPLCVYNCEKKLSPDSFQNNRDLVRRAYV
jgi:phosphonoacetate hydrolase